MWKSAIKSDLQFEVYMGRFGSVSCPTPKSKPRKVASVVFKPKPNQPIKNLSSVHYSVQILSQPRMKTKPFSSLMCWTKTPLKTKINEFNQDGIVWLGVTCPVLMDTPLTTPRSCTIVAEQVGKMLKTLMRKISGGDHVSCSKEWKKMIRWIAEWNYPLVRLRLFILDHYPFKLIYFTYA